MTLTAIIAGEGALPPAVAAALRDAEVPFLVAEPEGIPSMLTAGADVRFRLERLAPFLDDLVARGVTRAVLAGAARRPRLDPALIDPATAALLPRIIAALKPGDDATLRILIDIFSDWGIEIVGAHEVAPALLPPAGVPTKAAPGPDAGALARLGEATVAELGRQDRGQACVVRDGTVIAREDEAGTDAMLARLPEGRGGILFKAPKPGQDRRADLPVIGPGTAEGVARAGLSGIVIEAGGVMMLDASDTLARLDGAGLFLWVRPPGAA